QRQQNPQFLGSLRQEIKQYEQALKSKDGKIDFNAIMLSPENLDNFFSFHYLSNLESLYVNNGKTAALQRQILINYPAFRDTLSSALYTGIDNSTKSGGFLNGNRDIFLVALRDEQGFENFRNSFYQLLADYTQAGTPAERAPKRQALLDAWEEYRPQACYLTKENAKLFGQYQQFMRELE
ncbi:MAG: hypothetical protein WCG27_04790, partial [Pseudomonadota bacterium]